MVSDLDRRLAAGAESAAIHRMVRCAFQLLGRGNTDDARLAVANDVRVRVHDPDRQSAASLAQRADARLPDGDARNDVFVRDEADQLVLGIAATREGGAGAGDGRELDEGAA